MRRIGHGRLNRRAFGPKRPLPWTPPVRLAYYFSGLALLIISYETTGSEGVQWLVGILLVWFVHPVLARIYGTDDDEHGRVLQEKVPPRHVWLPPLGLALVLLPVSLVFPYEGMWVGLWIVLLPPLWLYEGLARRESRRTGSNAWKDVSDQRVWTASAWSGAAVTPFILAFALLDDIGWGEAVLTAVGCGLIVFTMTLIFSFLILRALEAERDERQRKGEGAAGR